VVELGTIDSHHVDVLGRIRSTNMPAARRPTRALDMGGNDISTTSPPLALDAHQGRAETQDQVTAPALDYGPIDLDLVADSLADDSGLGDRALLIRGKLTAIHGGQLSLLDTYWL
jgi:hypothetical protein